MEEIDRIIKEELYAAPLADECLLAFLCGAIRGAGEVSMARFRYSISFVHSDKSFIDLIENVIFRLKGVESERYETTIDDVSKNVLLIDSDLSYELLESCFFLRNRIEILRGIPDELFGKVESKGMDEESGTNLPDPRSYGRRAFLRGLYLASGSLKLPKDTFSRGKKRSSGYQLSLYLNADYVKDDAVKIIAQEADIEPASVHTRKRGNCIFLKNSQAICNFLVAIGGNIGVLRLYDVITDRKMKNDLNRAQNCEIANIDKTVGSSSKQIAAIKEVDRKIGIANLPERLQKVCEFRLQNREAGLEEIANMFDPPVTKSCVNHRLRRIMELAGDN